MKNTNPTELVLNDIGYVRTVLAHNGDHENLLGYADPLQQALLRAEALTKVLVDAVFENAERDDRGRQYVREEQIELAYMLLEQVCNAKAIADDMFDRPKLAKETAA